MIQEFFKSKIFWLGLVIRLVMMPLFDSHYMSELFIPFVDSTVSGPFVNPWEVNPPHFFPYGSVLFLLLYIPKQIGFFLFGSASLGSTGLSLFLMKLPLLAIDFLALVLLSHVAKARKTQIILFYWLNPIVIYVSYVHGQLDLVSTIFSLAAVLLLGQKRVTWSAVLLALATLSKFHVVILLPFFLVYLWNGLFAREAIKKMTLFISIWAGITVIGFLPLLLAHKFFYASTSSPEALRLFGAQLNLGNDQTVYLGVLLVLGVLGRLCISTRVTERGLFFGSGLILGTLLIATSSAAGWYIWVVPFFSVLFAVHQNLHKGLFASFVVFYLIYFLGGEMFEPTIVKGFFFTVLQASTLGILTGMWTLVIRHEAVLRGRARPQLIGIAGDSASGKNYLSELLIDIFSPNNTISLEGDDYHKWERNHEQWERLTHLDPRANHLPEMSSHTSQLVRGLAVKQAQYDHDIGTFSAPREIKPHKTVILQGLHTFYLRDMRSRLDLKIFLAPNDMVRLGWKLARDVESRGHSPEKVLTSWERRQDDAMTHIGPQRQFADWIIEYLPVKESSREEVLSGKTSELIMRYVLWNDAPVFDLVSALSETTQCSILHNQVDVGIDRMIVEIRTGPTKETVEDIANRLFPNLRHITRAWYPPKWRGGFDGVTQLVTVALLQSQMSETRSV